jgi:hypothetical protein
MAQTRGNSPNIRVGLGLLFSIVLSAKSASSDGLSHEKSREHRASKNETAERIFGRGESNPGLPTVCQRRVSWALAVCSTPHPMSPGVARLMEAARDLGMGGGS